MLAEDVQKTLPIWTYLQVRNILTVLADFLDEIESDRMIATGLAGKLRTHIDRIDGRMKHASSGAQGTGLLSMGNRLLPSWRNLQSAHNPSPDHVRDVSRSYHSLMGPDMRYRVISS